MDYLYPREKGKEVDWIYFLVDVNVDIVSPEAQQFSLICIHTQPKSANVEIDRLVDVQQYVSEFLLFLAY